MNSAAVREPLPVRSDEARFLRMVRGLVGLAPVATAADVLAERHRRIDLSAPAMTVLQETLSKGVLFALVRGGGHEPRRTLRGDGTVRAKGRLWERHEPPPLVFSHATMDLLRGFYELPLVEDSLPTQIRSAPTVADEVVFFLAACACKRRAPRALHRARALFMSDLVRVGFPLEAGDAPPPDYAKLLRGPGAIVLEALRGDLAARVYATEMERHTFVHPQVAVVAGAAISAGAPELVRRAIAEGRPDLGLFLLDGVERILDEWRLTGSSFWMPRAGKGLTLAERQRISRGGEPILTAALSFRTVLSKARAVGFVDDGYEAAQMILQDLEPWAEGGFDRVQAALKELSSFDVGSGNVGGA